MNPQLLQQEDMCGTSFEMSSPVTPPPLKSCLCLYLHSPRYAVRTSDLRLNHSRDQQPFRGSAPAWHPMLSWRIRCLCSPPGSSGNCGEAGGGKESVAPENTSSPQLLTLAADFIMWATCCNWFCLDGQPEEAPPAQGARTQAYSNPGCLWGRVPPLSGAY
ncbi:hypothetical protein GH733_014021 [Mirounga leonina]|nr:hypothetical protein GH733_014021 [Mirounga leonina]